MKKLSKLLILLPLFCVLLVISSCSKDVKNPFIGTWKSSTTYYEYTFKSNKTFEVFDSAVSSTFTGTYYYEELPDAVNSDAIYKLTLKLDGLVGQKELNVSFPNSRTMIIGSTMGGTTYYKQ